MRKPIMAANWKMNKTSMEAVKFMQELANLIDNDNNDVEVVVCPPFTALRSLSTMIDIDKLNVKLGAQNMHWEPSGAYTGEISALMLNDLRVDYVIIGHSERRQYFLETDEIINKKVHAVMDNGMRVIMCVGESLEQREAGQTQGHIINQVNNGLAGVTREQLTDVVIAYEPIWAIGTGRSATPDDANEVCRLIRDRVSALYDQTCAEDIRVLYGGSVSPANVNDLMTQPDIDGGLVGGASLEPKSYSELITGAMKVCQRS